MKVLSDKMKKTNPEQMPILQYNIGVVPFSEVKTTTVTVEPEKQEVTEIPLTPKANAALEAIRGLDPESIAEAIKTTNIQQPQRSFNQK